MNNRHWGGYLFRFLIGHTPKLIPRPRSLTDKLQFKHVFQLFFEQRQQFNARVTPPRIERSVGWCGTSLLRTNQWSGEVSRALTNIITSARSRAGDIQDLYSNLSYSRKSKQVFGTKATLSTWLACVICSNLWIYKTMWTFWYFYNNTIKNINHILVK